MEAHGPDRFRFEELDPGAFEELCFLLARIEDQTVRRLRAPDGGLDAAVFGDDGALRGWQAKRRARLDWADMENSLATAVERHRVRRVTFCFPVVLTADQQGRFAARLQAANPEVALDYWDAGELTARLLDPRAVAVRERFFRQSRSLARPPLDRERLPRLAGVGWQELGVARGAFLADEEGWTAKLERSVDRELAERLGDWRTGPRPAVRFLVLSGPPGSGKTRGLLDALRASLPDSALLLAPSDAEQAREIAVGWHRLPEDDPRPVVLWLDDLERFLRLDETGLTRDGLLALIGRDPGLLVAATCHGKGLSLLPPDQREIDTLLDTVVDAASLHLRLDHRLSEAELEAAARSGIDAGALEEISEIGVGPYVLAIERLHDRVARATEPQHQALIGAALDWTASGVVDPISRPALRALWERRLAGEPSKERFREALDWAQEPIVGRVALMFREDRDYFVPPLLAEEHRPRLDAETVAAVLELADQDQAEQVAVTAAGSTAAETAIAAYLEGIEGSKAAGVAGAFAVSLISSDKREAGIRWLRWAAAGGDVQANRNLGISLYRRGQMEESQAAHERADAMGDATAATCLAMHLLRQGRDEEALAALRRADERGDADGSYNLADALHQRGNDEEARVVYRRAIERGSAEAATALGAMIGNAGDHEGALELFRLADERGEREGSRNLGLGLERICNREGALAAYRRADERGDPEGALYLGRLLLDDDLDAALAALNRADDRGSAEGAVVLGEVLGQLDLLDYAEAAFRNADRRGSGSGALELGALLEFWDASEEAEAAYRRADERGEPGAAEALGLLLDSREDPEAQGVLERADRGGSAEAALALAVDLANRGDLAAAEEAARRALDRGSADAGRLLGEMYLRGWEEPRFDDALEALGRADKMGSAEAALLLSRVLGQLDRDPELADAALRRAEERGSVAATMAHGGLHHEAGEAEEALACFARAELAGEPAGAAGAASVFVELGLRAEAIEALRRALAGGREDAAIPLAQLLIDESEFEEALATLEAAVRQGTPGAEEQLSETRELLDRLEREHRGREDPESRFQLGAVLHCSGRLEEAVDAYEIAAGAGDAEAAVQMANILFSLGETERAIEAYRLGMEGGSGRAAFLLGVRLDQQGDATGAREAWTRAEDLGEGGGACQLGSVLEEAGDAAAAEAAFRRAVERGHGHGARMLARLLREQGRGEEAAEQLRRAEAMDEGEAATELGRLLLSMGDCEGAREAFSRNDRRGEAAAAFELGRMLMDDREFPEATAALRRAEARGHEAAMRLLTEVLFLSGRSRDAERIARSWHVRGSWLGSLQLAAALVRRGEFGEVDEIDDALRERAPPSGHLQYARGWLLFSAGRTTRAVAPLRAAADAGVAGAEHVAEFAELGADTEQDGWAKRTESLYESGNPLIATVVGETALKDGDLELAEEAFRRAFEHGGRAVGEQLADVLDRLGESGEARQVRERMARLTFFDDPLIRPMRAAVEHGLDQTGMQWLHEATVRRSLGFLPDSDH